MGQYNDLCDDPPHYLSPCSNKKKIYYHVKNAQKYHMSALELVEGYKTSRLNVKMLIIFYWMLIIECLDGVLLSLVSVWLKSLNISPLSISNKDIKM